MYVRFEDVSGRSILENVGNMEMDCVPRIGDPVCIKDARYTVNRVTWFPYHGPIVVVTLTLG